MDYLTLHEHKRQVTHALARQLGSMELATRVTEVAVRTVGGIHNNAADMVATTLATAGQMVKAASYTGRITPDKEAELRRHTQEYLSKMLSITHDAGSDILDVLLDR